MAENLKTTKYRNGDQISRISDKKLNNLSTGAFCDYSFDAKNSRTYGNLYNWYSVTDKRKVAPEGWHVPSDKEWDELANYLGGERIAGGKL